MDGPADGLDGVVSVSDGSAFLTDRAAAFIRGVADAGNHPALRVDGVVLRENGSAPGVDGPVSFADGVAEAFRKWLRFSRDPRHHLTLRSVVRTAQRAVPYKVFLLAARPHHA